MPTIQEAVSTAAVGAMKRHIEGFIEAKLDSFNNGLNERVDAAIVRCNEETKKNGRGVPAEHRAD